MIVFALLAVALQTVPESAAISVDCHFPRFNAAHDFVAMDHLALFAANGLISGDVKAIEILDPANLWVGHPPQLALARPGTFSLSNSAGSNPRQLLWFKLEVPSSPKDSNAAFGKFGGEPRTGLCLTLTGEVARRSFLDWKRHPDRIGTAI